MMSLRSLGWLRWVLALGALFSALAPRLAMADVRLEGEWGEDRSVTLDASGTSRAHAVELLATAAGWSVVVNSPLTDPVDIHVKDQPATKVLALLLPDGDFVARRSGDLVSIRLAAAPVASVVAPILPVPATPPTPPVPAPAGKSARGEDRTVFGGDLTIQASEIVHDVTVFGGSVDIYGTVTGDLSIFGGSSRVHDGAKVLGTATAIGGEMHIDDGATVEHDIGIVGGHLVRGTSASVGTDDLESWGFGSEPAKPAKAERGHDSSRAHPLHAWAERAESSLSAAAFLFVFGAVVIALATDRSRALRVEVAARPMRTFALGIVGALGAVVLFVALCITLIGIPVALLGAAVLVVAAYAGVSAVLTTAGEALLGHRTTSPYVHLAVGCALYLVIKLIPLVGGWVTFVMGVMGIGVMVATRGAGLLPFPRRKIAGGGGTGEDFRYRGL